MFERFAKFIIPIRPFALLLKQPQLTPSSGDPRNITSCGNRQIWSGCLKKYLHRLEASFRFDTGDDISGMKPVQMGKSIQYICLKLRLTLLDLLKRSSWQVDTTLNIVKRQPQRLSCYREDLQCFHDVTLT